MPIADGIEFADWAPDAHALWHSRRASPGGPDAVVLRHPTHPFVCRYATPADAQTRERVIRCGGSRYVVAASGRIPGPGLPRQWTTPLAEDADGVVVEGQVAAETAPPAFGWLASEPGEPTGRPASFWFAAVSPDPPNVFVLVASEWLAMPDARPDPSATEGPRTWFRLLVRSGLGLRVVAQVRPIGGGREEIRFTGLTASIGTGAWAPTSSPLYDEDGSAAVARLLATRLSAGARADQPDDDDEPERAWEGMLESLRLDPRTRVDQGVRFGREGDAIVVRQHLRAVAREPCAHDRDVAPYGVVLDWTFPGHTAKAQDAALRLTGHRFALIADQHADARVFGRDPSSQRGPVDLRERRPTRDADDLDAFRLTARLAPRLEWPDPAHPLITVVQTPFVLEDVLRAPGTVKTADLSSVPDVRSDEATAVSALFHPCAPFERLDAYGIDARRYFRSARPPLEIHYRSGVRPGPGKDGRTVNARVLPKGWKDDVVRDAALRPQLELHFALAAPSRRARGRWDRAHPAPARPLGVAADPRWVWHETGHVLLMATVGVLELAFAHSPGDALAAIVSDPASALARGERATDAGKVTSHGWRGATFPWVFIPRRHDRCVLDGWSWSGTLHRGLRELPHDRALRRKGYWSEQILSSSLFRLYLCLGGDTVDCDAGGEAPDVPAREWASHYAVFLIVKALGLLANAGGEEPPNHPDHFVTALIEADTTTESFELAAFAGRRRVGGCAHKLVRWAFEAQGLYPADPDAITDAPGLPPPVDVYVADRRPPLEATQTRPVAHGPGSYVPISLDLDARGGGARWLADEGAVRFDPDRREIRVIVGNRGRHGAHGVAVRVWTKRWRTGVEDLPDWDVAAWTEIAGGGIAVSDVAPDSENAAGAEFGPFPFEPGRGAVHLVLVQASCDGDRASNDPATGLPCSREPTPLVDLVAGDNNLGLRIIDAR